MTERELTCIVCPRGCTLHVTKDGKNVSVSGNGCPRGREYAVNETTHPVRTLTGTVRTEKGTMLPVRTSSPIPKELLFAGMAELRKLKIKKPFTVGEPIVKDFLGTGADLLSAGEYSL